MTAQNDSTQNQEPNAPKLNPDFSHRLSAIGDGAKLFLLVDAINTSCLQAESTLAVLSGFFTGEAENTPSDAVIFWTLHGVMQTIKDIDAIVKAYDEATKAQTDSAEAGSQRA